MTTQFIHRVIVLLLCIGVTAGLRAQPTAFTYQGRLNDGASPGNGSYDLRLVLHGDAVLTGFQVGVPQTNAAVAVSNGLFTTTVDFGPAWDNQPRWIEVGVRPAGGLGDFTTLAPRQPVTVTPKADYANRAAGLTSPLPEYWLPASALRRYVNENITGLYTFDPLPGNPPFVVNTAVLVSNLNVDKLDGLDSSAFWKLDGNAGTSPGTQFLGTVDDKAIEMRVRNEQALRLAPGTGIESSGPNIVGGGPGNSVASPVGGAVIGGGWGQFVDAGADGAVISGGHSNRVGSSALLSSIGGGRLNEIGPGAQMAVVAGGQGNRIGVGSYRSVIGGGSENLVAAAYGTSVVGGGSRNSITGQVHTATISGGRDNLIGGNGFGAAIPGGSENMAFGANSFAAGYRSRAYHDGSFVWADNAYPSLETFGSTATNQFLIRASGGVGIGTATPTAPLHVSGDVRIDNHDLLLRHLADRNHGLGWYGSSGVNKPFGSVSPDGPVLYGYAGGALGTTSGGPNWSVWWDATGDTYMRRSLNFAGSPTGQMINLWGTGYAIGVQNLAQYFRTAYGGNFHWYAGGVHSSSNGDSGGGSMLMSLSTTGVDFYRKDVRWSTGGVLADNQGGSIELGDSLALSSIPFIDFHHGLGSAQDYNVRLINDVNGQLSLEGSLRVTGTISSSSDRNVKQNFVAVDTVALLEKVASLPIQTWAYTNRTGVRHIGPMAQDFHAAFAVGADNLQIATVDADGVALAAIQGLNQKVEGGRREAESRMEELKRTLVKKETEITDLKQRLEKLEQLLNQKLTANER